MKKIKVKILASLICSIILFINICYAETTKSDLENEKNQINNQISDKEEELEDVQNEKSSTMKEVETLNDQISDYEDEIESLEQKEKELNNLISESEQKLKKSEEDFKKQESLLNERLVSLYEAGDTTYLDVLMSSEGLTDLISNWYLVSELASYDTDLLEKINNQKQEIENAKITLENNKNDLVATKTSKQTKTSELKTLKTQKDAKVSELSEEEKEIQAQIQELQNHEKSVSAKIAQLQKQFDNSNNTTTPSGNYGFIYPVNASIGTGYGVQGSYWSSGYHTGVDFRVSTGTPVKAIGDGIVVDSGYNTAYGYFVEIYHGNNIYSFYAHASSLNVSTGATVTQGQIIMYSGATGNVTGPHLHFEIRSPGSRYKDCVNPMAYL